MTAWLHGEYTALCILDTGRAAPQRHRALFAAAAAKAQRLAFHVIGDFGGIHGDDVQVAVAEAMEGQIESTQVPDKPSFLYHVGDVVYFNGQSELYGAQFYEPYQYYPAPIFAIPGNHNGDTRIRAGNAPDSEPSLYGFTAICIKLRQAKAAMGGMPNKTDRNDARAIAQIMRTGWFRAVHEKTSTCRSWRSLLVARRTVPFRR